jgi:hypothetical protein
LKLGQVVRTAYADPFYANLAKEAIHAWKNESWLEGAYHEYDLSYVMKSSI